PAFMRRKDGHSAWASSAPLQLAGIDSKTVDPAGGVIDRDGRGVPTGILRETAMQMVSRIIPNASAAELDQAMAKALMGLSELGITSVHSMDTAAGFAALQRLHAKDELPVRVTYNLPLADLHHAER